MRLLILSLATLPVLSFALENCQHYPDFGQGPYKPEITRESTELSFGDCPDSLLIENKYVARLFEISETENAQKCIYKVRSLAFICDK